MAFLLFAAKAPLVTYHVPFTLAASCSVLSTSAWAWISSHSGWIWLDAGDV